MKFLIYLISIFSITYSYGQSALTQPNTNCKFVLPWTCDECTFHWSESCVDNLPQGTGVLTVFNEGNEIMRYEGEMKNGKFDGLGSYRDEMNQMTGRFINGKFAAYSNQYNAHIDTTHFNKSTDWELKSHITKQVDNLYFIFPAEGYAYEHRDELVKECIEAFDKNCKIINCQEYNAFTKIRFVTSKKEMLLHSNIAVSGQANYIARTIDLVLSNEDEDEQVKLTNPPITHEIMHMVSNTVWGRPPQNLNWLNEGLATFAENNCSGYTVAEIYRYFLVNNMLIPIETLCDYFYQTEEMVGYHQSGYIAEYLIDNYGIQKLESLWKNGFSSFESIYGFPYSQLETELNKHIMELHPITPEINWEMLKVGCK